MAGRCCHWCCSGRDRQGVAWGLLAAAGHQPVPELELPVWSEGELPHTPLGSDRLLCAGTGLSVAQNWLLVMARTAPRLVHVPELIFQSSLSTMHFT